MLPLKQAQEIVLAEVRPQETSVSLFHSTERVLSQRVVSPQHSPLFDNSAMDDYAVFQHDSLIYEVIGLSSAGQAFKGELTPGQAIKIMTGAVVPESATAVIPIEEIESVADFAEAIQVTAPIVSGQHIRFRGEEYQPGDTLLEAGIVLNPASVGLLATLGYSKVPIYRVPRVAILATGSELLEVDDELNAGKIRDSNSAMLAACVHEAGAIPVVMGIIKDERKQIKLALTEAFKSCDLVLSSGGVSVGDFDYVQEILLELGMQKKFWKVAIKPGKPVLFGTLEQKLVFGLPGNPASALVVFEMLVRPALRAMMGYPHIWRQQQDAVLTEAVEPAKGRLLLMRVLVEAGQIYPLKGQGSSNLLTVSKANALLPVDQAYAAGDTVRVWRFTGQSPTT